jgi:hypothetical protein
MAVALYVSIWSALFLFAAGETGRGWRVARPRAWAWRASATGLLLAIVHVVLAYEVRHAWSHQSALLETARQTTTVYGLDWAGGLYVNYAFLTVWAIDLWMWRAADRRGPEVSRVVLWMARGFYLVVIVNAAVVFAAGMRRALGVLVVVWLVIAWRDKR